MAFLKQLKTSVVGALFLVFLVLLGLLATWQLCEEVISFRPKTVVWSFARPSRDRIRRVLQERHAFDAYQLIHEHTTAGDKVYFLREFDVPAFITFYQLMSLLYPRELFPIRQLGAGWTPQDRRDGQAVFVLDYSSALAGEPRLTTIAQQGSCTIWAYTDTD
ncbi:MAG: hypothetical protein V3U11_03945 [Planctomycetota bacterium]